MELKKDDLMYVNKTYLNVHHSAIFDSKKKLMDEIWETGYPIYVDESYYTHDSYVTKLEKNPDNGDYKAGVYKKMSDWRDCHYYHLYEYEGQKFWIMSGGRYD